MEGLQRPLEEISIARLERSFLPTGVGSLGIGGLTGVSTPPPRGCAGWEAGSVLQDVGHLTRQVPSPVSGYRTREIEWRQTHRDAIRAYAGEWVVLEGERLIAHGSHPGQVVADARARGIQTPYVFYIEPPGETAVKMGL